MSRLQSGSGTGTRRSGRLALEAARVDARRDCIYICVWHESEDLDGEGQVTWACEMDRRQSGAVDNPVIGAKSTERRKRLRKAF